VAGLFALGADAATFNWSGGATGAGSLNFSNTANWSGGTAPSSNVATDLVFNVNLNPGTTANPLVQNITSAFKFHGLWFESNAGPFVIGTTSGNDFQLDTANATISMNGSTAVTINNPFTHSTDNNPRTLFLVGGGSGSITLAGVISDSNGNRKTLLNKSGNTTFVLTGANSYDNGTTIGGGTLVGGNASAFGGGAIDLNAGTLSLALNTGTSFGNDVNLNGNAAIVSDRAAAGGGVTHTLGALSIGANTLTIAAGTNVTSGTAGVTFGTVTQTGASTFDVGSNANLTLPAISGNFTVTKQGNGSLTLNNASTRTVGSVINGGTVVLGSGTGLGTGSVTISGGTLNITTVTDNVASLSLSSGTVTASTGILGLNGNIVSSGTSGISASITLGATRTFNVTNTLTASGRISGAGFGINKTSAGELILSGGNIYTGLTDIQGGQVTLKSGGNIAGSIRVAGGATFDTTDFGVIGFSVATGQTLSGSGTVNGTVKIGGANTKISPGDVGSAPAALGTGTQEWASGGTYVWDIKDATGTAGAGFDQLQIAGALTVSASSGSKFNIDITSLTAANANGNAANFVKTENYDWVIATASGGVSIDPTAFNFVDHFTNDTTATGVPGSVDGAFSISGSGTDVILHYSAAPEPGAIALLGVGIAGYLSRRPARRRLRMPA
jgi:autotransporter-associated beta strand protein